MAPAALIQSTRSARCENEFSAVADAITPAPLGSAGTFTDHLGDPSNVFSSLSSPLSTLTREATFLVALPYRSGPGPRAWGFWTAGTATSWIGPRHINFGDGSICAFSPDEGAWSEGGDLRTLIDLYNVWALAERASLLQA